MECQPEPVEDLTEQLLQMKTYFVYIVKCKDNSFYTCVTSNLELRIDQHEGFSQVDQAILWEKKIKGWSRRKKIALIESNWDDLVLFSKNYTQFGNKINE